MSADVMEPELELEQKAKTPNEDPEGGDGDDDEDRPGYVITYANGKQPILVRLEGTDDEDMAPEDVFERLEEADKKGHRFLRLGRYRGRLDMIRDVAWSEDVDYPELIAFENVQDKIDGVLETLGEVNEAVGQATKYTVALQQNMAALQQAQAQAFYDDVDGEDDEGEGAQAPKKVGQLRPLRFGQGQPQQGPAQAPSQPQGGGGKGKLPPGVRPS